MSMMNLDEAARLLKAPLLGPAAAAGVCFDAVSTDSRSIAAGDLFIALRGENFDGHEFIAKAQAAGAVGAVVAADVAAVADGSLVHLGLPLIVVADTRLALGELAAGQRYTLFLVPSAQGPRLFQALDNLAN